MAMDPGRARACACFSLCSNEQAAVFRTAIPRWVSSAHSPWYAYLQGVYGDAHMPPLPINLAHLNFFYHVWPFSACDESGSRVPAAQCGLDVCKPWTEPNAHARASTHNLSVALAHATDLIAATPMEHLVAATQLGNRCDERCQRAESERLRMYTLVLRPSERGSLSRATVLFEPLLRNAGAGNTTSKDLARIKAMVLDGDYSGAANADEGEMVTNAAHLLGHGGMTNSGGWVEVIRMNDEAYWRGRAQRAFRDESTNGYGIWFLPAAGSGLYLNVGRTAWVHRKLSATTLARVWHSSLHNASAAVRNASHARLRAMPTSDYELVYAEDLGFDSVQFQFNGMRADSEVVLVGPEFAHRSRPVKTCPPQPALLLRTGWNASGRPCSGCNDDDDVLNCGSGHTLLLPGGRYDPNTAKLHRNRSTAAAAVSSGRPKA